MKAKRRKKATAKRTGNKPGGRKTAAAKPARKTRKPAAGRKPARKRAPARPARRGKAAIVGVLLAGGLASRMGGGDKGFERLGGRQILDRIVERARPQVAALAINANGDPERFRDYCLPVIADVIQGYAGPLAGILTGLEWAAKRAPKGTRYVASFATDAPFVPRDLVARLRRAMEKEGADLACAASGGRTHPVFGLWPIGLAGALRRAMEREDMRKIDRWTARFKVAHVEFATDPIDPFFNINDPRGLAEAERLLAAGERAA